MFGKMKELKLQSLNLKRMAKDKYDFIQEILEDKKLTPAQRERVFELTKVEIQKDGHLGKDLEQRISVIEQKIKSDFNNSADSIRNSNRSLKKHRPKEMVKFLYNFSQNDSFKYFTHKPDSTNVDYSVIFIEIEKKLKDLGTSNLNLKTVSFVKDFLQSEGKLKIEFPESFESEMTYGNKEVQKQLFESQNPFRIEINGKYFSDVVNRFKNSIEFRLGSEEYPFKKYLKKFIKQKLGVDFVNNLVFTESFNNLSQSLNLFIDVNNLYRGIEKVLEWILKYKSFSTNVIIDMEEEKEYYELIIFHKDSFIERNPENSKFIGNSGDLQTVRKYLFSIVDFGLEADLLTRGEKRSFDFLFLSNEAEMYIEPGNVFFSESIKRQLNDSVGGVKYKFRMYKNL